MLHLISYISDHAGPTNSADNDCAAIVRTSKAENPKHDITGVLFFTRNQFLQVIEGEEAALRQLMRNIEADARHCNVEYLVDTPAERRGFQQWNMDFFKLGPNQRFDAPTMKELSRSFEQHLLPHSHILVPYYKSLLER